MYVVVSIFHTAASNVPFLLKKRQSNAHRACNLVPERIDDLEFHLLHLPAHVAEQMQQELAEQLAQARTEAHEEVVGRPLTEPDDQPDEPPDEW
jgi:hypothetical protein